MATFVDFQDELKTCPYNRLHKVATRRYQQHVNECASKSNVKLKICEFNSLHRVPFDEYEAHVATCRDGKQLVREMIATSQLIAKKEKEEGEKKQKILLTNDVHSVEKGSSSYDDDDWNNTSDKRFVLNAFKEDSKEKMAKKDQFFDPLVLQRMTRSERRKFYEQHLEKQKELNEVEQNLEEERRRNQPVKIEKDTKPNVNATTADGFRIPKNPPGFGGVGRGQAKCLPDNYQQTKGYDSFYDDDPKAQVKPEKAAEPEKANFSSVVKLGIGRGVVRSATPQVKKEKF